MTYTPRPGDTVRITARITDDLASIQFGPIMQFVPSSPRLRQLVEAGEIELVARAEPNWKPGEIGQHIEADDLFVYAQSANRDAPSQDWFCISGLLDGERCWYSTAELAGKLRRVRLVFEDEQ